MDIYATMLVTKHNTTLYVDKQEAAALLSCLNVNLDLRVEMGL